MKLLSFKWKLYHIINYILLLVTLLMVASCLIIFINAGDDENLKTGMALFTIAFLFLFLNKLVNIYIVKKFFPDKLLTSSARTLHLLSLVAGILIGVSLSIVCFIVFRDAFIYIPDSLDKTDQLMVILLLSLLILHYYSLLYQLQVPRFLTKNHENSMTRIIDSIGK